MSLRSLDLFSGIGGFALALKDVSTSVAFCDIDADSRAVLADKMKRGLLRKAPIFHDVSVLSGRVLCDELCPNLLCAGFPCQDLSVAKAGGKGLHGSRSGLFREIVRILAECKNIDIVFLENSSNIVNKGLDTVQKRLRAIGFETRNIVTRARDVGAPHKRTRWFLLGVRRGRTFESLPEIRFDFDWASVNSPRVVPVPRDSRKFEKRCAMLGNAVVPQCVCNAWNMLCGRQGTTVSKPWTYPKLTLLRRQHVTDKFPTPTFQNWNQYRKLTPRGIRNLGNFVYYDDEAFADVLRLHETNKIPRVPDRFHLDSVVTVNPVFVEWIMGYPKGWTRF